MKSEHTFVLCAETYRTPEQGYNEDDFFVDGMKLLYFPYQEGDFAATETTSIPEHLGEVFQSALKLFVAQLQNPESAAQFARSFPKFHALTVSGKGYWYHITTNTSLAKRPKEFNSNAFTEEQLLGVSEEDTSLDSLSLYFNSDGDLIEAPPDKFMLSLGAA